MWRAPLMQAACTTAEAISRPFLPQGMDRLWVDEEMQDPQGAGVTVGRVHQNQGCHPCVLPWSSACCSTKESTKGRLCRVTLGDVCLLLLVSHTSTRWMSLTETRLCLVNLPACKAGP